MAKVIRYGKTPVWGAYDGDSSKFPGVIIDSYNYSVEIKDYEQTNEAGQVKGYLIYDQTLSFDISGTLLYTGSVNSVNVGNTQHQSTDGPPPSLKIIGSSFVPTLCSTYLGYNQSLNNPSTAIVKSFSVNTSQGSAATFSISGTIYDITDTATTEA